MDSDIMYYLLIVITGLDHYYLFTKTLQLKADRDGLDSRLVGMNLQYYCNLNS